MAKLRNRFCVELWDATSAISVMKMLAEQAEYNIKRAVDEVCKPDAVLEEVYDDYGEDEHGVPYTFERTCYTYGSCIGLDRDEVKNEYIYLITQLTRRSAFLTIYGLFEHRMNECVKLMLDLCGYTEKLEKGTLEKTHQVLKKGIGAKGIVDVDHLTILRNIMAHGDGIYTEYKQIINKSTKKTPSEKRTINALNRAMSNSLITVNDFGGVLLKDNFLSDITNEIERYIASLNKEVERYSN